jgi:MarR family transcriptional regulator, lower aerobic nicotinate degradation pathway regulator
MRAPVEDDFLHMPGHLLRRCHQIGVAVFLDQCRPIDLTPLQFSALAALDRFGAMDQASLGGAIALDRTTIRVVLTRLEKRGLVRRRTSPKDRRSKLVEITASGRRLVVRALPSVIAVQDKLLAPLSARERSQLIAILSKVADHNNALSRAPHRLP